MSNVTITSALSNNILDFFKNYLTNCFNNEQVMQSDALALHAELKIQSDSRIKIKDIVIVNNIEIEKSDADFLKNIVPYYTNHRIPYVKYIRNKYKLGLIEAKNIVDSFICL